MHYYYSPSTGGFYIDTMNPEIPTDAVELKEEDYLVFISPPEGKFLVFVEGSAPVLKDLTTNTTNTKENSE